MKAISIKQPWAWLILHADKDIENRTWPTKQRGRVLIHAGTTIDKDAYPWVKAHHPDAYAALLRAHFHTGGIVGAACIVGCTDKGPSPWFMGPYGWLLAEATELPFVPCKGKLSFFDVDASWLEHQLSEIEIKGRPERTLLGRQRGLFE